MAALGELGIDPNEMDKYLLIQDWYGTAVEMVESLKLEQADGAFKLIIIDTLASFFPGDNSNDNAQVMAFLRGVWPLTGLDGNPTVVIAAHPVKNAADDNLVPYGGGAILNEVDGNLTMMKMSSTRTMLHWQGKIRGIEFDPLQFECGRSPAPPYATRTVHCSRCRSSSAVTRSKSLKPFAAKATKKSAHCATSRGTRAQRRRSYARGLAFGKGL
jgi:hypothetical protein